MSHQRVDISTVHLVEPEFDKIAEAIEHAEGLFFNLVKFVENRNYINPMLNDTFN